MMEWNQALLEAAIALMLGVLIGVALTRILTRPKRTQGRHRATGRHHPDRYSPSSREGQW